MSKTQSASWAELLRGRNGLRSLALAGGVALHAINVYIVTTILPSVVQDIGGLAYYAWNTTLFVSTSILGSALSPKGIDKLGLHRVFLFAILIFVLGTMACALAPSMPWMLAGRTVQGLGGGLLLGLSYSAVRLVFEEPLWPRAMVLVSSMWGIATLAGPAIGGIFAQDGNWRLAFWMVLPFAAGLAWLVHTQLAGQNRKPRSGLKAPLGKIAMMIVSVLMVSVASLSDSWIWNFVGLAAGALMTVWIGWLDRHSTARILPTGTYVRGSVLASVYLCVCLLSMGVTIEVFIPYFLQIIHGTSPLLAGYLMVLLSAGWTLGAFLSSGRSTTTVNKLIKYGPMLSAVSLALLAMLMPMAGLSQGTGQGFWWMLAPLIGVGLGVGLCWPHLLTRVFKAAPAGQESIASAAIITLQLYAIAMGASLAGMITNAAGLTTPGGVVGAQQAAAALFAIFACAPALAIVLGRGARRPVGH
jgi:MFS family permease